MTPPTVAEIVTLRLTKGTATKDFLVVAAAMTPFLRSTGSMTSRTLSVDDTGVWTDHVTWVSLDAAQTAARQMFSHPDAEPFMKMIDPSDMTLRHLRIGLALAKE